MIGSRYNIDPTQYPRTKLDFFDNTVTVTPNITSIDAKALNVSISNEKGQFQFRSNGLKVFNKNNAVMENGNDIMDGPYTQGNFALSGYAWPSHGFSLPSPKGDSTYYMFQSKAVFDPLLGDRLIDIYVTYIDMRKNNGLGGVVSKKQPLISTQNGTFQQTTATKHANGRDWWILVPEAIENKYYRFLLTPEGFVGPAVQEIGSKVITEPVLPFTGKIFTPDGGQYIDYNCYDGFSVFDFDRCTGLLSNERRVDFLPNCCYFAGADVHQISVSPNSRYLYVTGENGTTILTDLLKWFRQYDLQANDIAASVETIATNPYFTQVQWDTSYGIIQLAPDGRIYGPTQDSKHLHVIQQPNRKGALCHFVPMAVVCPDATQGGLPHYPNYRLGPIDGSVCDSLGLNNLPLCNWHWDRFGTTALVVEFSDNSAYEPTTWYWDFDGLATSQDTNPVFTFPQPGVYEVCLTVCNQYACDTLCRYVNIGVSATQEVAVAAHSIHIMPNPSDGTFTLAWGEPLLADGDIEIFSADGRLVQKTKMEQGANSHLCKLPDAQAGVYWVKLNCLGRVLSTQKLIILP